MDPSLPDRFLTALVAELDGPHVEGIIHSGSHAFGGATIFSDVDLGMVVAEGTPGMPHKEMFYRAGRLVSVGMRPLSWWRAAATSPEQAVFFLVGVRDARILLDHHGTVAAFQAELRTFDWASLQPAASAYVSAWLVGMAEVAHKLLSARVRGDTLAISDAARGLWYEMTRTMAIGRGVLVESSTRYLHQVEGAAGLDSAWTHWHRAIANTDVPLSTEEHSQAALHLYAETVRTFAPTMQPNHRATVEETVRIIARALEGE